METLTDEQLLSFASFLQREQDKLKLEEARSNTDRRAVLLAIEGFTQCLEKYKSAVAKEIAAFQKCHKKLATNFGDKMVHALSSFISITDSSNTILEKLWKVLLSKTGTVAEAVGMLPKSLKTLQRELQALQVDHGLARKEFMRKKGYPVEANPLVDREANKYEGFLGDISRLMKDSINQKIMQISHSYREHNKRESRAAIAFKEQLQNWVSQIIDFTELVKDHSESAFAELQTNFETSSGIRQEDIKNIIMKDQALALVLEDAEHREILCTFEDSPELLEFIEIDQAEQAKSKDKGNKEKNSPSPTSLSPRS